MSKILNAKCDAQGNVTFNGYAVKEAVVMSEGKQSSDGLLLLDEKLVRYLTSSASDIKLALEKVSDALAQISSGLQSLDAASIKVVSGGITVPAVGSPLPPAAASSISAINSIKAEIDNLAGALK